MLFQVEQQPSLASYHNSQRSPFALLLPHGLIEGSGYEFGVFDHIRRQWHDTREFEPVVLVLHGARRHAVEHLHLVIFRIVDCKMEVDDAVALG